MKRILTPGSPQLLELLSALNLGQRPVKSLEFSIDIESIGYITVTTVASEYDCAAITKFLQHPLEAKARALAKALRETNFESSASICALDDQLNALEEELNVLPSRVSENSGNVPPGEAKRTEVLNRYSIRVQDGLQAPDAEVPTQGDN